MTFDKGTYFKDRHSINLILAARAGIVTPENFSDAELVEILLSSLYLPEDRDALRPVYEKILVTDIRRRLLCRGQVRQ